MPKLRILPFPCSFFLENFRELLEILIQLQDNLSPVVQFCHGDRDIAAGRVLLSEIDSGTRPDMGVWKLSLIIFHNVDEIFR